jgi:glycosyltransferase involved in cell wall biosynthesis
VRNVIYVVHQYFPRHIGGTEILTRGLVRRAKAAGWNPTVVTAHESGAADRSEFRVEVSEFEGIPLHELHFNLDVTHHPMKNEYDNSFVATEFTRITKQVQPSLVHVMHPMKLSGSVVDVCARMDIPVIVTLCDYWLICPNHSLVTWDGKTCAGPDGFLRCLPCVSRLHGYPKDPQNLSGAASFVNDAVAIARRPNHLRRIASKANRLIALSNFQKNVFVQRGYPAEKIQVINHGIETDDFDEANEIRTKASKPLVIGFIGSVVPIKGLHVLVKAMRRIPGDRAILLIYGKFRDDAYCAEIREMVAGQDHIQLMGEFAPAEFGRILRGLDVLAMPAQWHENDPLVIKAALYARIPVIASKIGCLPEMIADGETGWLVQPEDPQSWFSTIENCIAKLPLHMPEVKVKTMDETASEFFSVYETEALKA